MGGPVLSHCEQLKPYGPAPESLQRLKVSDLIQSGTSDWDIEKIEHSLPFHKGQILKIKPNSLRAEDALVWLKNSSGEYSTRSGYLTITEEKDELLPSAQVAAPEWFPSVWNIKTSEKIKIFI